MYSSAAGNTETAWQRDNAQQEFFIWAGSRRADPDAIYFMSYFKKYVI